MSGCLWCDKSLPGAAIPACGSCILRPLDPPEESQEDEFDGPHDLSFLSDKEDSTPAKKVGKSQSAVMASLHELALESPAPLQEVTMRRRRLKSNSLRNRSFLVGSLALHFNSEGIAEFPAAEVEQLTTFMKHRPGRFTLLEEEELPDLEEKLSAARELVKEVLAAQPEPELPEPELPEPELPEPELPEPELPEPQPLQSEVPTKKPTKAARTLVEKKAKPRKTSTRKTSTRKKTSKKKDLNNG